MARPKKEGKAVSLLMDKNLFKELEDYCNRTYLSKTAAIEKALKIMIEQDKKNSKTV